MEYFASHSMRSSYTGTITFLSLSQKPECHKFSIELTDSYVNSTSFQMKLPSWDRFEVFLCLIELRSAAHEIKPRRFAHKSDRNSICKFLAFHGKTPG